MIYLKYWGKKLQKKKKKKKERKKPTKNFTSGKSVLQSKEECKTYQDFWKAEVVYYL